MSNQVHHPKLEDVLDAYVTEVENPLATSLAEWIKKYPQYSKELTEFTVSWSLMETLPPNPQERIGEESIIQQSINSIRNSIELSNEDGQSRKETREPIINLLREGRNEGFPIDELADKVDLSAALVRKLDRRLIQYITIPLRVMESFALVLKREVVAIAKYLSLPSNLALDASYKTDQKPSVSPQQNFFDAVRDDIELSEEHRARWLAYEYKEK